MPECATCEEYISPDFVRVFGDNNRIVTACLSCRGSAPESAEPAEETKPSEAVRSVEDGFDDVETEAPEYESPESEYQEPLAEADSGVGTVEPETAATAGESSPMAFLRSVFLR